MRISLLVFFLISTELYADDFALNPVEVRAAVGRLYVSSTGTPPATSDLENRGHWVVTAKASDKGSAEIPVEVLGTPKWSPSSSTMILDYTPPGSLGNADPRTWTWRVTYTGPGGISASSAPKSSAFFSGAKGKPDADIYVLGTFLAGEGTKPLYTLDSKIGWVPEWGNHGIYAGVEGAVTINSSAKPPVNRTQTDPDSITADINVHEVKSAWLFSAYPLKGEFSRKYPASDLVSAGTVQWAWEPKKPIGGTRGRVAFYPSVGIEGGHNLSKPSTIGGQPVDLSGYGGIFRGVVGAYAAYYVRAKKPDPSNPYQFSITSTFVDRIEAMAEPFLTTSLVNGKSLTKAIVGRNPRAYIETDLTWNITPLLGLTVKDTWESLPPMFSLTGQQVTVGMTFKAKLPNRR